MAVNLTKRGPKSMLTLFTITLTLIVAFCNGFSLQHLQDKVQPVRDSSKTTSAEIEINMFKGPNNQDTVLMVPNDSLKTTQTQEGEIVSNSETQEYPAEGIPGAGRSTPDPYSDLSMGIRPRPGRR